ncbi:MAG: sulfurase [Neomegalonema sp.]|nr:sulfurase [Neomegalonema sp.]
MPILSPTEIYGEAVFLGVNPDRRRGLETESRDRVEATYAGFEGDAHSGLTRPACSRVKLQYARGVEIKNARQVSIVSEEELAGVAADMGAEAPLHPGWIGASLSLRGIPELTHLPPSSRLVFDGGVSLVVDMQNNPCRHAGDAIDAHWPGLGAAFPKHARDRRGVVAWVEKTGALGVGEACRLHIPPQRIYAPAQKTKGAAG